MFIDRDGFEIDEVTFFIKASQREYTLMAQDEHEQYLLSTAWLGMAPRGDRRRLYQSAMMDTETCRVAVMQHYSNEFDAFSGHHMLHAALLGAHAERSPEGPLLGWDLRDSSAA